jgi:predicted ATPase/DNA-binding CsgD family transcriptional regulator
LSDRSTGNTSTPRPVGAAVGRNEGAPRTANNLPLQLSSLVGREREIAKARDLLAETRLLTLTGPGGSGKTRLALAVAAGMLEDFDDGTWLVELAPLSDPDLVPQAVASVLGVREAPGDPLPEVLVDRLRTKSLLLVLDNCEHMVDACASLVRALLRSCPNLRILATSRETLGVPGETIFAVPPLSLPDPRRLPAPESLPEYEAARLFVERARAVKTNFSLDEDNTMNIARICYRLDGMPLAIELAAARVRVLSPGQISTRLEESSGLLSGGGRTTLARHATLRATMDWSYDLLSEEERVLFRRLSVFAGGFTLEATEAVGSGEGAEQVEVLELLASLVDKSLLLVAERDGETRYRLLETVRQYGLEKLQETGDADHVYRRHAEHYLALAEEAASEPREQGTWLEKLGIEHGNLRAALRWALDREESEGERAWMGLRLATALARVRFWAAYGEGEGLGWLERGIAGSGAAPAAVRAKALSEAGYLAIWRGDYRRSVALLEESKALFEELEDKPGVAASLFHLGSMALHGGDHESARPLLREAEALRWELEDRQAIGSLLYLLAFAALDEGDHARAVALAEEGLALDREVGDLRGIAMCLTILGVAALEQGDPEHAATAYEEEMRVQRRLKDKTGIAYGLRGLSGVAAMRRQPARAARTWGAAEALSEATGLPLSPFDRSHPDYEGLLAVARSRLDAAAWETALAEGRAMTPAQAVEYALEPPSEPEVFAVSSAHPAGLSAREVEVLRLVAQGMTNAQIAKELFISPRTVNAHLGSVYHKIGTSTRAEAARFATEHDLL